MLPFRRFALLLFSFLSSQALAHAAPSASTSHPFAGIWTGTVTAPNATAELSLEFTSGKNGVSASLTMRDMFVHHMPLGPAQIVDETYTLAPLGIRLTRNGDVLTGTFANPLLEVELHRGVPLSRRLADDSFVLPAPPPLWSRPLGAQVWASPVARDGVIYVGCVDGKFHAVGAGDGSELWTWSGPNPLYGEALATENRLWFLDDHAELVCLDRADGRLVWRTPLHDAKPAAAPAPVNETFNHRVPVPVLADGMIYVGSPDQGLYALSASNGKILWRHDAGAAIYASVTLDGDRLIAGCYDGSLLVLSRRDGAELARTKLGGRIASAPVIAGDMLIVGCRDYLLYGLRRSDLGVAWRNSYWFSWVESVPRLVDGLLYIGGSDYRRISALNPATGAARWVTDVFGLTWGTPVVTADRVYAGTSSQNPAAINHGGGITALDRRTGAVKWRLVTPLPANADRAGYLGSLVFAGGKIIGAGYEGVIVAYPAN